MLRVLNESDQRRAERLPPVYLATARPVETAADGADEQPPAADAAPDEEAAPSLGAERLPPCHEPWKSLYVLRRGIYPCCYGGEPIAGMDDHQTAWNSPQLQEIRRELAAGRFPRYCLESPSCPIVRKAGGGAPQRPEPRPPAGLRRLWRRVDGAFGGVPGRLLAPVKPLLEPLAARRSP